MPEPNVNKKMVFRAATFFRVIWTSIDLVGDEQVGQVTLFKEWLHIKFGTIPFLSIRTPAKTECFDVCKIS